MWLAWCVPLASASPKDAKDLDQLLETLEQEYPWLDPSLTDLVAVSAALRPRATAAATRAEAVAVFEIALASLVDAHATLGTNLPTSPRLVPSGTDVWAEEREGGAMVTGVRPGWPAAAAGLVPGDVITTLGGISVREAIAARLPPGVALEDPRARSWALLVALAGSHDDHERLVTLADGRTLRLGDPDTHAALPPVTSTLRDDGLGVIVLHDLGDEGTIAAFDDALEAMKGAPALVLDLRDTAAGGSTSVAEPVLGRFVTKERPYQLVIPRDGEGWQRTVAPRGPWTWEAPLYVLVDRWTGSMGEGMAVGLDALGATVVGTPMAGLRGSVTSFRLRHSKVPWNLPTDRLSHLDGTPREAWSPPVGVRQEAGVDAALQRVAVLAWSGEPLPDGTAPRPFLAEQIRDAMPLGAKLRYRMEPAGAPAIEERWEVVAHDAGHGTIASKAFDPATGELVEDQGANPSAWADLVEHAAFPAAATEVSAGRIAVPAGTFDTLRYTVTEGTVTRTLHFARPGPPVSLVVEEGGAVTMSMVLLERSP